ANNQHYELPAEFFEQVLGKARKYSCGWWPSGVKSLDEAEELALQASCERANLAAGQDILELGCGWGSLSLWMASHYPGANITAISNSNSQGEYIRGKAREQGLTNLRVVTADMNDLVAGNREMLKRLVPEDGFDRVVSVEMFEHMSNWPALFESVRRWLREDGQFFMHIFCHRHTPYEFSIEGDDDWMAKYFFTGGIMPSDSLPPLVAAQTEGLQFRQQWRWYGNDYAHTANAWLANMDARKAEIMPLMRETYGEDSDIWWNRWRLFFMACAELFAWRDGREWWVGHYLFERTLEGALKQEEAA
ncbi:MAG: SAM-dependent methyltransferase, partial [Gammaproteobacteria bacterium]